MAVLMESYIAQIKDLESAETWLDETFDKKLKGINDKNAFTRPINDLHSVAEIISHLIEWRKSLLSIFKTGKRTVSMDSPENWKTNEELKKESWKDLLKKLKATQKDIISFLSEKDDKWLKQKKPGGKDTFEYYVIGLIQHDVYHLGQIGIVRKYL